MSQDAFNPRVAMWESLPMDVQFLASIASIFSQKIDAQIADATAANSSAIASTIEKLVGDMADMFVAELKRSGRFAAYVDDEDDEGLEDDEEDEEDEDDEELEDDEEDEEEEDVDEALFI